MQAYAPRERDRVFSPAPPIPRLRSGSLICAFCLCAASRSLRVCFVRCRGASSSVGAFEIFVELCSVSL